MGLGGDGVHESGVLFDGQVNGNHVQGAAVADNFVGFEAGHVGAGNDIADVPSGIPASHSALAVGVGLFLGHFVGEPQGGFADGVVFVIEYIPAPGHGLAIGIHGDSLVVIEQVDDLVAFQVNIHPLAGAGHRGSDANNHQSQSQKQSNKLFHGFSSHFRQSRIIDAQIIYH